MATSSVTVAVPRPRQASIKVHQTAVAPFAIRPFRNRRIQPRQERSKLIGLEPARTDLACLRSNRTKFAKIGEDGQNPVDARSFVGGSSVRANQATDAGRGSKVRLHFLGKTCEVRDKTLGQAWWQGRGF